MQNHKSIKGPFFSTRFWIGLAIVVLFPAGCLGVKKEVTVVAAETAARRFFAALNQGDYRDAVALYGGSYETLAGMNPDLDPADRTALLARGCEFNGFNCLKMGEVLSVNIMGEGEFILTVQFLTNADEVFFLGPCCGEDETTMPPISEFSIHVVQNLTGGFKILDLPPYVP